MCFLFNFNFLNLFPSCCLSLLKAEALILFVFSSPGWCNGFTERTEKYAYDFGLTAGELHG